MQSESKSRSKGITHTQRVQVAFATASVVVDHNTLDLAPKSQQTVSSKHTLTQTIRYHARPDQTLIHSSAGSFDFGLCVLVESCVPPLHLIDVPPCHQKSGKATLSAPIKRQVACPKPKTLNNTDCGSSQLTFTATNLILHTLKQPPTC